MTSQQRALEVKAEHKRESAKLGLCICGEPLVEARKQCVACLQRSTAYSKHTQSRNKAAGKCPCGRVRDTDRKYCRRCLDAAWARTGPRNKAMKRRAVDLLTRRVLSATISWWSSIVFYPLVNTSARPHLISAASIFVMRRNNAQSHHDP